MSASIERHNPDGVSKGRVSLYNHCVRVTNATTTLYLAGQLARDEHGQTVGVGDIRAQTEQVIKNIRTILRAAEGGDLEDLVKVTVFTTDMRYFDAISEVRRRHFGASAGEHHRGGQQARSARPPDRDRGRGGPLDP